MNNKSFIIDQVKERGLFELFDFPNSCQDAL
jgi:hypothetical protein